MLLYYSAKHFQGLLPRLTKLSVNIYNIAANLNSGNKLDKM